MLKSAIAAARKRHGILRAERGAADPMLVLGSIAVLLILLLGGAFAVIAFINSSHDTNAQSDLDKVGVAEASYFTQNTSYLAYDSKGTAAGSTDLQTKAAIGFQPSAEGRLTVTLVNANKDWVALSKSASQAGTVYIRTSSGNEVAMIDPATGLLVDSTDPAKHNGYVKVGGYLTNLGVTAATLKPLLVTVTS